MNEALLLSNSLRQAAANVGTHIVPTAIHLDDRLPFLQTGLTRAETASLIEAVHPQVLYLQEITLVVEDEIEATLDEAGLEHCEAVSRSVTKVANSLNIYAGEFCRVLGNFVVDGVLHHTYAEANWTCTFEQKVEAIVVAQRERTLQDRATSIWTSKERVRELATTLIANPAFNSGRVSAAKRRYLAGKLFPQETDELLNQAVELADHMDWHARSLG